MDFYYTYDQDKLVTALLQRTMTALGIKFRVTNAGTLELPDDISTEILAQLKAELKSFGVVICTNENQDIVDQIKFFIRNLVYSGDVKNTTLSELLTSKLGYSYPYLSNQFSCKTYTSIENFYILVRIEKVKELVLLDNTTLSEIAFDLNFSSVPHLSNQFKKVTGLTITQYLKFKKIKEKNSSTNA